MKSFDLNALGVQEMNAQETCGCNGGSLTLGAIAAGIIIAAAAEIIGDWDNFKAGINGDKKQK